MELKTILISELPDFVKSDLYKNAKTCPITVHRAISQLNNPRADKNDPALIIATDKNNIVGFIGFLPDKIKNTKVYWNSCWWVNKEYSKVAIPLLLNFIKTGKEKISLTDYTPHTKEIVNKLHFFNIIKLNNGFRGYLKLNLSEVLPKRNVKLKPFRKFFKIFDRCINMLFHPKTKPTNFKSEEITTFNKYDIEFIKTHSKHELIQRNSSEIEWVANFPWVKNTSNNYKNYPFTSSALQFSTHITRLTENNKTIAIIYLRRLNNHLTIPFIYYEAIYVNQIAQFIYNQAVNQKCIDLTIFNIKIAETLKKEYTFIIKRELTRDFAFHESLQQLIKNPVILQDGDGDVAFC